MIGLVSVALLGLLALSIPAGLRERHFFPNFPVTRGWYHLVCSSANSAALIGIRFFVLLGLILLRSGVPPAT
jgi:hypothetical protein